MGTGSPVDFTTPAAEEWWREQVKRVLRMGVAGIKADDGECVLFARSGCSGRQSAGHIWAGDQAGTSRHCALRARQIATVSRAERVGVFELGEGKQQGVSRQ